MIAAGVSSLLLLLSLRGEIPGIVACFALVPLVLELRHLTSALRAGILTFVTQLGLLLPAFEGAIPALPWTFPVLVLLAAPAAMLPGALSVLARRLLTQELASHRVGIWSLPFCWTASEFLASRREIWGQFASPVALGYTQFDSPFMSIASFGGVTAVTLAVLAVNVALAEGLVNRSLFPLLPVALIAFGLASTQSADQRVARSSTATVGMVQPALAPGWYEVSAKLDDAGNFVVDRLAQLSSRVSRADVVVWPEGALPPGWSQAQLDSALGPLRFEEVPVLAGGIESRGGKRFNSLLEVSSDRSEKVFDKLAPVPVGEAGISPGRSISVGNWGGLWMSPLICLDSLYPKFSREARNLGAEALLVVSDDSFARRMVTPRLHLLASAFRAVESGVPLVFASAHGPSAVLGPRGEVLATTEFGRPASLLAELPPPNPPTFYVRHGDYVGYLSVAVVLGLALAIFGRRRAVATAAIRHPTTVESA